MRSLSDALEYAKGKDLDLVEVAPNANPPVCRVMDYSRYKYEQNQRKKEAKKKQRHGAGQISVKEMKFRPKIDAHDYATKVRHVERFLREGSKVKLTIMFRGREVSHPELGKRILDRVADEVGEIAEIEHYPRIDGRNMTMVLSPLKDGRRKRKPGEAETPERSTAAPAPASDQASPTDEPAADIPTEIDQSADSATGEEPAEMAQEPAS